MTLIISLVVVLLTLCAAAVAGVNVRSTRLSKYELKRLANNGDTRALKEQYQETYRNELSAFLRLLSLLLLLGAVVTSLVYFGTGAGLAILLIVALVYMPIARLRFVTTLPQRYFEKHSPVLIDAIARSSVVRAILSAPRIAVSSESKIHSRDELLHVVEHSGAALSVTERDMLMHSLRFNERTVSELMVPRESIATVPKNELLGPLVLDDLHKTGHNRFPVIDRDLDSIIGILHLRDLLTLDSGKKTSTAEKAMDVRVEYIHASDTLRQALGAFLHHHHHLLIVVDKKGETVGLLTIEDVIEALFGRRLDDEFIPSRH
ncbi:hypothetical protein A2707_03620 [Candidatus Saccharibacteria bacterium RIFCSPHIGHO2_01_FULL_45_15]|nr:MAG: hypothetical protein A2707_03620 [Candidatus Saccharibacteria bacterium RIFCSPHIGHO2_01_FULL_45_15]OGL28670.1 MAG: hypothetical protein A3C39_05440 [Candidatus Saccharibacteria bacterium RIFCSPHIGHO2_02_FULL_46_12]OGL31472.1 MAG: hypothetical protein A3E76_03625 [Candidatus Saccharibacteria bacterium RIFCSPHIGHO2_12_FULL_44_22]